MDKYPVTIRPEALEMLDLIYFNICQRSLDNTTAENLISALEQGILSLAVMPWRGSEVVTGTFANRGYKILIIKNHLIIYTILEDRKEVVVIYIKNINMNI